MPKIATKKLIAGLISIVIFTGLTSARVYAQELPVNTDCGGDTASYSALYQAPIEASNLFVKLGQPDQVAAAALYYQPLNETTCTLLGKTIANGNSWTNFGSMAATAQQSAGTFKLVSEATNASPGANRPTVMLVSQSNPVCQPTTDCLVTIGGRQAALRATGTLLNEDSLHVVTAKDPSKDTITKVNYYTDNKLVYSRLDVQPFDMRYVSSGQHTLATVINYSSRQQALIKEDVKRPYYDDITYYFFRFVHVQKSLLVLSGWILLVLSVLELLLLGLHYHHRHKVWKDTHFAKSMPVDENGNLLPQSLVPARPKIIHAERLVQTVKRVVMVGSVLAVAVAAIAVLNSFIVQPFQVDGPSMQSSLLTGDSLLVDKTHKAFAKLTSRQYVPKRGQVVVFIKEHNVVFESTETEPTTYVVKRVIGLPGERVVVNGPAITVYNKASPGGFDPDANHPWTKDQHKGADDPIDITLQPDQVFLVGDNRPDSIDSRNYGPVTIDEIVGQAMFKALPLGKSKIL